MRAHRDKNKNARNHHLVMNKKDFRVFSKYYDHVYLEKKNYQEEAKTVREIIKRFEKKPSTALLDVGCGTGEHLKYFSSDFQCMGIDINRDMIEIAKKKVPNAEFKVANMMDFGLREMFDVIVCLFSSIGYGQNFNNLVRTLENFYKHLNEQGLAIVEPWIFKKDFIKGYAEITTYENEEIKFVRMATSKIEKSKWLIFMHYLIGEEGKIRHVQELHEMLAIDGPDYMKAFKSNHFRNIEFLKETLWKGCRGLFIAVK
jgi:ubiquinone/menaquinone biosynthesis C-methylase UbiE